MRVLVQRCKYAKVTVDKKIVGQVDNGIMALVSFTEGDNESNINYMVDKIQPIYFISLIIIYI